MTDREAFEAWYRDFYNEPLPAEYRIVDIYECWQAAIKHEREACAKVCDDPAEKEAWTVDERHGYKASASAIRARAGSLPQQEG